MTDEDGPTGSAAPPKHASRAAAVDVWYSIRQQDDGRPWVAVRTEKEAILGVTSSEVVLSATEARSLARDLLEAAEQAEPDPDE